jgi:hypothetical protein
MEAEAENAADGAEATTQQEVEGIPQGQMLMNVQLTW